MIAGEVAWVSSDDQAEAVPLRRENRRLEMEVEIHGRGLPRVFQA